MYNCWVVRGSLAVQPVSHAPLVMLSLMPAQQLTNARAFQPRQLCCSLVCTFVCHGSCWRISFLCTHDLWPAAQCVSRGCDTRTCPIHAQRPRRSSLWTVVPFGALINLHTAQHTTPPCTLRCWAYFDLHALGICLQDRPQFLLGVGSLCLLEWVCCVLCYGLW